MENDTKHTEETEARDVKELLDAANLITAVAYRRQSEALHELAAMVMHYTTSTFGKEG